MNVLLLNAGSSSLKCSLIDSSDGNELARGLFDWASATTHYHFAVGDSAGRDEDLLWNGHAKAVARFLQDLTQAGSHLSIGAVGHRVVHGGAFTASVRVTPEVRERLASLIDLAPLHNPPSLATLTAAQDALPNMPHVATFDTAFHATLPPEAWTYPIPGRWTKEWGLRRYGFHGLSHAYCARRAVELLGSSRTGRLVICHLGHGCSASAVRDGQCIDTTMGFTPLDGLMMGTRCGSIDPSIVLQVQQHHGLTVEQVEKALNKESGLLGVSGVSADMREVMDAARAGNRDAELALAVYAHRVRQAIGALAVTLGGVDALVFTAGVGEHAAPMRESICAGLACLGLTLDTAANAERHPDADIATADSAGRILIIATREDVTMLREVLQVLASPSK
ncbi:MAG TPA: acetate/propionate family kinase [Gemmataceae bacterium]|nr:acetate/propionate family kinase [Gemmataceae bacterium]